MPMRERRVYRTTADWLLVRGTIGDTGGVILREFELEV